VKKRLGLVIKQERCIGCAACTVACKIENESTGHWIHVETVNVDQKDTPEGSFPDLKMTFLPQTCMHCQEPPCIEACPAEALIKREDGPVILNEEQCNGCQACMDACPYNAILFSEENSRIEKCNLCAHRIDKGLEPFCVVCCEGQAIYFGDLNDPEDVVSKLIAREKTFQLKTDRGTGPSIYYCPPREPKRL
jgi:Fe-S-cluster-containing dehydrogenase component